MCYYMEDSILYKYEHSPKCVTLRQIQSKSYLQKIHLKECTEVAKIFEGKWGQVFPHDSYQIIKYITKYIYITNLQ